MGRARVCMTADDKKDIALLQVSCITARVDILSQKNGKPKKTRAVKRWAADCRQDDDSVIHVAELCCHEKGCPDFETAVTWMSSPPFVVKIFKPIAQITREDVQAACSGTTPNTTEPCLKEHL